jgi:uncharacterized repeat protein (TIGR03803 family)
VYELSPEKGENGEKSGSWTEKTLFNFDNIDGAFSVGGLIFDSGGNLYGTTEYGACDGDGSVFELSPDEDGGWTEELLTDFGLGRRPSNPGFESLIRDAWGNLYGTTINGGKYGWGTVFEVSPNGRGGWTKKVLHDFENSSDGANPNAGVTFDAYGNLYGTTFVGGADGLGTVFELSPPAESGGAWTETVLYSFGLSNADATNPDSGVTFDAHGNLYGATPSGGTNFAGAVFELSPPAESGGAWTETVLHSFGSSPADGRNPYAGLILDREGNLYGTTQSGGTGNAGTVFEIIP